MDIDTTTTTYTEFGAPTVKAQYYGKNNIIAQINVPATGSVDFTPDEFRDMANFIENSPNSPFVKLLVQKGEPKKFAHGLRKAADIVEESQEQ